jgi:molybdopterin converting factor small subunit
VGGSYLKKRFSIMIVNMRYYGLVAAVTKKAKEDIELKKGTTVANAIDILVKKYGDNFRKELYFEGFYGDTKVSTPNLFLNKSRIQWTQDYPKGLKTPLKDGDMLWMGLIIGGG